MNLHNRKSETDQDLLHLIKDYEDSLLSVNDVSSIYSSNINKGSYKLIFESGRVLKWRKFEALYDAEKVCALWKYLTPENFPSLLKRYKTSILTEWIDGTTPSHENISLEIYKRCGKLLGMMHTTNITTDDMENFTKYTPGNINESLDLIQNFLADLRCQGIINDNEVDIICELVNNYRPQKYDMGLVLGDYCPENIVIKDNQNIYMIDNENLGIDCLDYDLARTFYRWPMNKNQQDAFTKGYEDYRSAENYGTYSYFWDIRVLAKSILYRTKANSKSVSIPTKKLKAVIKNISKD